MTLSDSQFGGVVVHQTPEGLRYHKAGPSQMRRAAVVDPAEPVKQQGRHRTSSPDDYYSPEVRQTHSDKTGQPLKNPRVSPNPKVTIPQTVAFADYHDQSTPEHKSLYIDYVSSRVTGRGHAARAIRAIAALHPEHELDFGRVMSPKVWKVKESLEAEGRSTRGRQDF